MMKIGLLREGKNDERAVKSLLEKISSRDISFNCIPGDGQIITKIPGSLQIFFGSSSEKVDIAFLISDIDKYTSREKDVRDILAKNKYFLLGEKIVSGFPDPNFEQWLISEEDAIKFLFKLDGAKPLPYSDIKDPKDRLQKIIDKSEEFSSDFTITNEEIYSKIIERINLKTLAKRDSSFQSFLSEAEKAFKSFPVTSELPFK